MTDHDDLHDRLVEIERSFGVTNASTLAEWVEQTIADAMAAGEVAFGDTVVASDGEVVEEPDRSGQVCILGGGGSTGPSLYTPEEDVPEWIGPEEDLPV